MSEMFASISVCSLVYERVGIRRGVEGDRLGVSRLGEGLNLDRGRLTVALFSSLPGFTGGMLGSIGLSARTRVDEEGGLA